MRHLLSIGGLLLLTACTVEGADVDDDGTTTSASSTSSSAGGGGSGSGSGAGGGATTSTTSSGPGGGSMMTGCESGPLAAPIPGCTPTPLPTTGDFHQDCVDRINQFRWECQCLPPLARWTEAESCTNNQSGADQNGGGAHANFGMCNENAQNTCPNWGSTDQVVNGCLQMMWDEGPGEPFSEHGHYINMSSTSYSKVACGFSTSGNDVWSNQNFAP